MGGDKEEVDLDADPIASEELVTDPPGEIEKTILNKRRTIDNLLEERRRKRQLADYDFDL